jgi:hypothetical protein
MEKSTNIKAEITHKLGEKRQKRQYSIGNYLEFLILKPLGQRPLLDCALLVCITFAFFSF